MTTAASMVPAEGATYGMKVRALPSAKASRGTEESPIAWTPIQ